MSTETPETQQVIFEAAVSRWQAELTRIRRSPRPLLSAEAYYEALVNAGLDDLALLARKTPEATKEII